MKKNIHLFKKKYTFRKKLAQHGDKFSNNHEKSACRREAFFGIFEKIQYHAGEIKICLIEDTEPISSRSSSTIFLGALASFRFSPGPF